MMKKVVFCTIISFSVVFGTILGVYSIPTKASAGLIRAIIKSSDNATTAAQRTTLQIQKRSATAQAAENSAQAQNRIDDIVKLERTASRESVIPKNFPSKNAHFNRTSETTANATTINAERIIPISNDFEKARQANLSKTLISKKTPLRLEISNQRKIRSKPVLDNQVIKKQNTLVKLTAKKPEIRKPEQRKIIQQKKAVVVQKRAKITTKRRTDSTTKPQTIQKATNRSYGEKEFATKKAKNNKVYAKKKYINEAAFLKKNQIDKNLSREKKVGKSITIKKTRDNRKQAHKKQQDRIVLFENKKNQKILFNHKQADRKFNDQTKQYIKKLTDNKRVVGKAISQNKRSEELKVAKKKTDEAATEKQEYFQAEQRTNKKPLNVDKALNRASDFMKEGVPIESFDKKAGIQFIQNYTEDGQKIVKRVGFDLNPESSHVQQFGPHLNLQTQINGKVQKGVLKDPHISIDPKTIRTGDY